MPRRRSAPLRGRNPHRLPSAVRDQQLFREIASLPHRRTRSHSRHAPCWGGPRGERRKRMRTGLREVLIVACLWIGGCGGGTTVSKADMGADGAVWVVAVPRRWTWPWRQPRTWPSSRPRPGVRVCFSASAVVRTRRAPRAASAWPRPADRRSSRHGAMPLLRLHRIEQMHGHAGPVAGMPGLSEHGAEHADDVPGAGEHLHERPH